MIKFVSKSISLSLFVVLLMMAFQTTAQKKVALEIAYVVGDKEKMELTIDQEITTAVQGMNMTINNTIQMWMDQTCTEITSDGHFKLEQDINRSTMNMMMFGQEIAVDTDEEPNGTEGPNYDIWVALKGMVGAKITVIMNKSGEVISTTYDEQFEKAASKSGTSLSTGLNNLALPKKTIKVGDKWKQSIDNEMKGLKMKITTNNEFASYKQKVANIAFEGKIGGGGKTPEGLELSDGKVTGSYKFDTTKGRFQSSEIKMTIDMKMVQEGSEIPMTIVQKIMTNYSSN